MDVMWNYHMSISEGSAKRKPMIFLIQIQIRVIDHYNTIAPLIWECNKDFVLKLCQVTVGSNILSVLVYDVYSSLLSGWQVYLPSVNIRVTGLLNHGLIFS